MKSFEPEVLLIDASEYSQFLLAEGYHVSAYDSFEEAITGLQTRLQHNLNIPTSCLVVFDTAELVVDEHFANICQQNEIPIIGIDKVATRARAERAKRAGLTDLLRKDDNEVLLTKINAFDKIHSRKNMPANEKKQQLLYRVPWNKRIFDILVSSALLVLLAPLFLSVMIAIRLESKGPVFYWQPRVGTGYRIFRFFKFRSMRVDADKLVGKMSDSNQYGPVKDAELPEPNRQYEKTPLLVGDNYITQENVHLIKKSGSNSQSFFKVKNDPRITKVGQFIRNTSIDELPQLVNVLIGDMSIVGNRPLPLYEAEKLTSDLWAKRFMAPAGITGLWQVTERGKENTTEESRKQLDNTYADQYSFWMDIKILLKTPFAAIQQSNV
jgi:lipopolysaccharide/colanic/teichoic acid biosynthesis glycosyltransferase